MKTIQLSIPKPCHEDWNTMSPQEKGRFCDKCCKSVLDFSNKTSTEIQEFILEHENEKLCGRFRNDQLNKPIQINIPYQSVVNRLNFSQAFLLSLLIVFGTALISCTTHSNETIGKINLIDTIVPVMIEKDSVVKITMGKVAVETPLKNDSIEPVIHKIKNVKEVSISLDTTIELPTVNIIDYSIPILQAECYSMGQMTIREIAPIHDNKDSLPDSVSEEKILKDGNAEHLYEASVVYPNPAHDVVNVKFYNSKEEMVSVKLYDMNGMLIRTLISSQHMSDGENNLQFDVSNLPPAMYLLRLMKNDRLETKRIVII